MKNWLWFPSMARSNIMFPGNNSCSVGVLVFSISIILFAPEAVLAFPLQQHYSDIAVWSGLNSSNKEEAVVGFARCYTALTGHKNLLRGKDPLETVQAIDRAISRGDAMPFLILKTVKQAPPDRRTYLKGGERYGDGEWWREMRDGGREAFAQGVLWCEGQVRGTMFPRRAGAVDAIIGALNKFYADDLEDFDPRTLAHYNIPYAVALKRSGALKTVEGGKPALRMSRH